MGGIPNVAPLSPEKEHELAAKILERAQMAHMTRQLKVGLSKVPNSKSKNSSPNKLRQDAWTPVSRPSTGRKRTGEAASIRDVLSRTSPTTKSVSSRDDTGHQDIDENGDIASPIKAYKRPSTPPRVPPSSSASEFSENFNRNLQYYQRQPSGQPPKPNAPSTPKAIAQPVILSAGHSKVVVTPKRSSRTGEDGKSELNDSDVAADLLMYLATSPCTKLPPASNSHLSSFDKIPTTPSASENRAFKNDDEDASIRFSHIKPSTSSPQSTFKQLQLSSITNRINNNNNNPQEEATGEYSQILMESPTLYISSSPAKQNRKGNSSNINSNGNNSSNNNSAVNTSHLQAISNHPNTAYISSHVPSTPSRELRSNSTANLLKTPNFNMGDYVHSLFSPSPRVGPHATNGTISSTSMTITHSFGSLSRNIASAVASTESKVCAVENDSKVSQSSEVPVQDEELQKM